MTTTEYEEPPDPPSAPTSDEATRRVTQIFNFHGEVDGGTIGVGTPGRSGRRSETGWLDSAEVTRALHRFASPPDYDRALGILGSDHVVVLQGEPGTGRTAAAIALLREFTGDPLLVLSPIVSASQLSSRTYEAGHGYLVFDRLRSDPHENEVSWRAVRDRLRDQQAYLVVTTTERAGQSPSLVAWRRPALARVLRSHVPPDRWHDELPDRVAAVIGESWTVDGVARFAARLADEDIERALEQFDRSAAERVATWFGEPAPDRDAIIDITTLAFITGASVNTFDDLRYQLARHLATQFPEPAADEGATAQPLPQSRLRRLTPQGLMTTEVVRDGAMTRKVVTFKVPAYRREVLRTLSERFPNPFWGAVRDWLDEALAFHDIREIAAGVATLAEVDIEEAEQSYLEPWSAGAQDWNGVMAAVFTLWLMCSPPRRLSGVALQLASRWAQDSEPHRQWAAAMAFSGELGLRFPVEGASRLWGLILRRDDISEPARRALALLFSLLVERGDGVPIPLTMLARHMRRFGRPEADLGLRQRTMASALELLSVRAERAAQPAAFRLLHTDPTSTPLLAVLWSGLLRHSRFRAAATQALADGLRSLEQLTDGAPQAAAVRLGAELARSLSPGELQVLRRNLRWAIDRPSPDGSGHLASVLLDALARGYPHIPEENSDGVPHSR